MHLTKTPIHTLQPNFFCKFVRFLEVIEPMLVMNDIDVVLFIIFFFWSRQRKDFYLKKQAKSSKKLILFLASLVIHLS